MTPAPKGRRSYTSRPRKTTGPKIPARTPRNSGEATQAAARKMLVLLELLRTKAIRFSAYESAYGRDFRSFQRDLQHLRKIGAENGFKISPIRDGERAELVVTDTQLRSLDASPQVLNLMRALSGALGAPISREFGRLGEGIADAGFLRLLLPQLLAQTMVGEIYDLLKEAWQAKPRPALVSFEYDPGKGAKTTRTVEPYRVLLRSGTAYLAGYDVDRGDWRVFALDRFTSKPKRAGTIQRLREVPKRYDSSDALGFFNTPGETTAVTVELTPAVAASITSRRWQEAQRIEHLAGGAARITFEVSDIGEVVRWALGLGKEAYIVAPPAAVELSAKIIDEIAAIYRA